MRAIDTNVLIHAHREEMDKHKEALELIHYLAEGDTAWAIPVFCISEFLRVATHPRVFHPPTPLEIALTAIEDLIRSPSVRLLFPQDRYWSIFTHIMRQGNIMGNIVFDAQIVALCLEHGVQTLVSEDRDMRRFKDLEVIPI